MTILLITVFLILIGLIFYLLYKMFSERNAFASKLEPLEQLMIQLNEDCKNQSLQIQLSEDLKVKMKDLQTLSSGAKKADWDVGLAVDIIKIAPKLDVVVLVSGDGDFTPLAEYLQNHGMQVEVVAFGKTTSHMIIEQADDFIDLSENPRKFLIRKYQ